MKSFFIGISLGFWILGVWPGLDLFAEDAKEVGPKTIILTSPEFREGGSIPLRHTCDGGNLSPELRWAGAPPGTQSFVILMEDPDAPGGNWVHWILFDLPPTIDYLPMALPPIQKLANAEWHGTNDFKKLGYGGPCPPKGSSHRYSFRIYALDTMLRLSAGITKKQLEDAMKGHVLAKGELTGTYQRK